VPERPAPSSPIRVGVSSCLLGEEVRYDGGHKRDRFLTDVLGAYFEFVAVCPEVELGMGIPRETVRLVRDGERLRMIAPASGRDYTQPMERYARERARQLAGAGLSGYVLKKGSPSCGMERVRVVTTEGRPSPSGRGLFATALIESQPLLPVEEEGRLQDAKLRENFIERIFAFHRLRSLLEGAWKVRDLVAFQSAEKLLVMAHDPRAVAELGRIVARASSNDRRHTAERYQTTLMTALRKIARPRSHCNVLHHIVGYFKKLLTAEQRREILEVIDDYRRGYVPLVAPIVLLRHYVHLHDVAYLKGQTYLDPHPKELMLRNHV